MGSKQGSPALFKERPAQAGGNISMPVTRQQQQIGFAVSHRQVERCATNADRALRRVDPISLLIAGAAHEANRTRDEPKCHVLRCASAIGDIAINDQRRVPAENELAPVAELELAEAGDVRAKSFISIDRVCSGDNPLSDRALAADGILGFNGSPHPFGSQSAACKKG